MTYFHFHPLSVLLLAAVLIWSSLVWAGRVDRLTHRVDQLEHQTYECEIDGDNTRVCTAEEAP